MFTKKMFVIFIIITVFPVTCFAVTLKNIPFASSFHVGLSTGVGTGINFGFDVEFPFYGLGVGAELEQAVTNVDYKQNISVTKVGLLFKQAVLPGLYLSLHGGASQFFVPLALTYNDFYGGGSYDLPNSYRGYASYWGAGLNYRIGKYVFTPKVSFNTVVHGGTIMQIDFNISHKL